MMLFAVIMAALILLLAIFSLMTAIQENSGKFWPILLIVLSLLGGGYAVYKLPYWSFNQTAKTTQSAQNSDSSALQSHPSPAFSQSTSQTTVAQQVLLEKQVTKQLATTYQKLGHVSFQTHSKTYTLVTTDQKFNQTMRYLKSNPTEGARVKWPEFTQSIQKTSTQLKKALGAGYTFQIKAGSSKAAPVLVTKDGRITSNITQA